LQGLILLEQCLTHERYQILAVLIWGYQNCSSLGRKLWIILESHKNFFNELLIVGIFSWEISLNCGYLTTFFWSLNSNIMGLNPVLLL
jgi:hypothetical protein